MAIEGASRRAGCAVEFTQIGDRPVASVDNAELVSCALRALEGGGPQAVVVASSTDANAALARGLPAIGFGVYRGGDAHRSSEWIDPASLVDGYRAFERLLACLAEPAAGRLGG